MSSLRFPLAYAIATVIDPYWRYTTPEATRQAQEAYIYDEDRRREIEHKIPSAIVFSEIDS